MRRRGRDLHIAGLAGTRRPPPPASQKAAIPSTPSLRRPGDGQRLARPPSALRMLASENHIALQKPPLRPLGPCPQTAGLEQDDPRLRLQPLEVPGGPEAGEAAADDDHVGVDLPRPAPAPGATLARLLQPVAVSLCAPSPLWSLPERGEGQAAVDSAPMAWSRSGPLDSICRRPACLRSTGARPRFQVPGHKRRRSAPTRRCATWSARSGCATTSPRSPRGSTSAPKPDSCSSRRSCSLPRPGAQRPPGS